MTPRERAIEYVTQYVYGAGPNGEHLEPRVIDTIEQMVTAAIEEDRKSRPHRFVGRHDRYCEWCNEPDRHENHLVPREWINNAVKQERETCREIAARKTLEKLEQKRHLNCCSCMAKEIEREIRARSES